jgi:ribosomal protein S18 acetylase RimI-like enzyme
MSDIHFQLRSANRDDLDAVYDLFAEAASMFSKAEPEFFKDAVKDDAFREFFERTLDDPEQHLVLACAEAVPVGFIKFFAGVQPENFYSPERRFAYIHQLTVTQELRRKGCANALIQHVKNVARKQNISLMGIDFRSINEAARACYASNGFEVKQEIMWLNL